MVHKFGDWLLVEAKGYSQESFDRIVSNIGTWLADALDKSLPPDAPQKAQDRVAKLWRFLTYNPKFQEYNKTHNIDPSSNPELVRLQLTDFGDFLNDMPARDSDKFLADLKDASDAWMWHRLLKDPNKPPGKPGRRPGSKYTAKKDDASVPDPAAGGPATGSKAPVEVTSPVTAKSLAKALGVEEGEVLDACAKLGYDAGDGLPLDTVRDLVEVLADAFGKEVVILPAPHKKVAKLRGELERKRKRIADLDESISEKDREMSKIMDQMISEIKKLNREREGLEDEADALESEIAGLEAQQPAKPARRPRKRRVRSTFSFDDPKKNESVRLFGAWSWERLAEGRILGPAGHAMLEAADRAAGYEPYPLNDFASPGVVDELGGSKTGTRTINQYDRKVISTALRDCFSGHQISTVMRHYINGARYYDIWFQNAAGQRFEFRLTKTDDDWFWVWLYFSVHKRVGRSFQMMPFHWKCDGSRGVANLIRQVLSDATVHGGQG